MGVDYANTRYIVMYGRNLFESLEIKAINNLLNAMEKGAKLTYIDPRVSITATKADRYWMIRPGTDLALNYALIHTILKERLHDAPYVRRWVVGKDFEAYYEPQKMHVSKPLGKIDPQCLEEYQDYDGYKALRSFYSQGFDSFLQRWWLRALRIQPHHQQGLRARLV